MKICPSDIHYSQDSISNRFTGAHIGVYIGESLDSLLRGKCRHEDFPTIVVTNKQGVWFTGDNRRLWVFKKAYELGKISEIDVIRGYVNPRKFTTHNFGRTIYVRGDPGGSFWRHYDVDRSEKINRDADISAMTRQLSELKLNSEQNVSNSILLQKEGTSPNSRNDNTETGFRSVNTKILETTPSVSPAKLQQVRSPVPVAAIKYPHKTGSARLALGAPQNFGISLSKLNGSHSQSTRTLARDIGVGANSFGNTQTIPSSSKHLLKKTQNILQLNRKDSSINREHLLIHPSDIRYSNRHVETSLYGKPLVKHVDELANGDKMGHIKVFKFGTETVAFENEKLWILQMAEALKLQFDVPLQYIPIPDFFTQSFKQVQMLTGQDSINVNTLQHLKLSKPISSLEVKPSKIHFTMKYINAMVNDTETIGEYLDKIIIEWLYENQDNKSSVLGRLISSPIMVFEIDQSYFSLDNRKLWFLKILESLGICTLVTIEVKATIDKCFLPHLTDMKDVESSSITGPGGQLWKQLLTSRKS